MIIAHKSVIDQGIDTECGRNPSYDHVRCLLMGLLKKDFSLKASCGVQVWSFSPSPWEAKPQKRKVSLCLNVFHILSLVLLLLICLAVLHGAMFAFVSWILPLVLVYLGLF